MRRLKVLDELPFLTSNNKFIHRFIVDELEMEINEELDRDQRFMIEHVVGVIYERDGNSLLGADESILVIVRYDLFDATKGYFLGRNDDIFLKSSMLL